MKIHTPPDHCTLLSKHTRCGLPLSQWLDGNIGGQGLKAALRSPEKIIQTIQDADLRGLGGSGFPTHKKWRLIANHQNQGNRYLICNGNEDEPGTFKDCALMEETPHQVIEGALIAAVAAGINYIIFYINPTQEAALHNMRHAIIQWQASPLFQLIEKHLATKLQIEVIASSGHYIGGEETAAIEVIEGRFPFPRGKPPYPLDRGIHKQPTLINNVETLANVSHILRMGAQWFQSQGLNNAAGTKLFCLSGDVASPGLYERPMGTTLNQLITKYGNGLLENKKPKAVFAGGPSSPVLTPKDFNIPLDFDSLAQQGASLGTGAMIVLTEGSSIIRAVDEFMAFFANASCGQCPPCKSGTYHASLLLNKLLSKQASREDLDTLISLGEILPSSGFCRLPDGAAMLLNSSLKHFRSEYEAALV